MAGAAGRAAKLSAEWKDSQRAAGIVNGRTYGRWEQGRWKRGDPGKRRPFSGTSAVTVVGLSAEEQLARSGAEAAVVAYARRKLGIDSDSVTLADLQCVCPMRPPPGNRTDLIGTIFESAGLAQAIAAAEEVASVPGVGSRKQQLDARGRKGAPTIDDTTGPPATKRPRRSPRIAAR